VLREAGGQFDGAEAGAGQQAGGKLAVALFDEAVVVEAGEDLACFDDERITGELVRVVAATACAFMSRSDSLGTLSCMAAGSAR
jgi:hypothetical protein